MSALTTYHDQLVLVGGLEAPTDQITNKLWTLHEDERTLTQTLPPMPTTRWGATAVSTDNHLIVAGGWDCTVLDVVEVYNGQWWMMADPLPKKCCFMKSTYHNGYYYLIGGDSQNKSMFYAHLQSLIENATQYPPTSPRYSEQQSAWKALPDVPNKWSSSTIFGGTLVAVGGEDQERKKCSLLYMYSPPTNSWLQVGEMPVAANSTCTITLPTGEMMVIGGRIMDTSRSCLVYKARLIVQ